MPISLGGAGKGPRVGRVAAVFALATALVAPATPAVAHDQLLSSTPEDQQRLDTAPEEVELTFSGDVMEVGAAVTILDSNGRQVSQGEPRIDGTDVSQDLAHPLGEDGYVARWRVVSNDGHPVSGGFAFAVGADAEPPDLGDVSASASGQESDEAETDSTPGPGARTWIIAGVGAAAGLGLYVATSLFLARRRAR